jgi:hypothetical protein
MLPEIKKHGFEGNEEAFKDLQEERREGDEYHGYTPALTLANENLILVQDVRLEPVLGFLQTAGIIASKEQEDRLGSFLEEKKQEFVTTLVHEMIHAIDGCGELSYNGEEFAKLRKANDDWKKSEKRKGTILEEGEEFHHSPYNNTKLRVCQLLGMLEEKAHHYYTYPDKFFASEIVTHVVELFLDRGKSKPFDFASDRLSGIKFLKREGDDGALSIIQSSLNNFNERIKINKKIPSEFQDLIQQVSEAVQKRVGAISSMEINDERDRKRFEPLPSPPTTSTIEAIGLESEVSAASTHG